MLFVGHAIMAQESIPKKGDFQFPIRPKQENYLSGTVGELRQTHFHMGLDIKTSGITGLPVYAAADGYVNRIRVSTTGYGNALYISHPQNNTITVYAHLKSFDDSLATYIRVNQYNQRSFEVNLFPQKNQFVFKKGDVIGLSGNSGSSAGPHLHFEVRTKEHHVLDPLNYGFDEIDDTTPPTLDKVAFVTMDDKSRINGAFGRFEFDVIDGKDGAHVLDNSVFLEGNIGVEVYAYDRLDRARNRNGILVQHLLLDNKPIFDQNIDHFEFNMARNILIHTNYERSSKGGRRFNKYYIDDGNTLDFYNTDEHPGYLKINDPLPHNLGIRLMDSYKNIVQYNFDINGNEEVNLENKIWDDLEANGYEISGNYLEFMSDLSDFGYCEAMVYVSGRIIPLQLAYDQGDMGFYIWDLRRGLPDSIAVCNDTFTFDFKETIYSQQKQFWSEENVSIEFPANSLFDTTYLRFNKEEISLGTKYQFLNNSTPVRKNITITFRPEKLFNQEKTFCYSIDATNKLSYVGGTWVGNQLKVKTRDFADYILATDTIPPVIQSLKTRQGRVKFKIEDEMSGVKSFEALLNDAWILMNHDAKTHTIWSDEKVTILGDFKLTVINNSDNETVFEKQY